MSDDRVGRFRVSLLCCRYALMLVLSLNLARAASGLTACVSDISVPPFAYWDSAATRRELAEGPTVKGVAVDVLDHITAELGLATTRIKILPLRRCLSLVAAGHIDMALSVVSAQIDPRDFYVSRPFYVLHSVYFYSRKRYPTGLSIRTLADLKQHQVCGLAGYTFDHFGLSKSDVDTGAMDLLSLLKKLDSNRCDIILEQRETVAGMYLRDSSVRALLTSPILEKSPLPTGQISSLHFVFGRHSPDGAKLTSRFDEIIESAEKSGEIEQAVQKHLQ